MSWTWQLVAVLLMNMQRKFLQPMALLQPYAGAIRRQSKMTCLLQVTRRQLKTTCPPIPSWPQQGALQPLDLDWPSAHPLIHWGLPIPVQKAPLKSDPGAAVRKLGVVARAVAGNLSGRPVNCSSE